MRVVLGKGRQSCRRCIVKAANRAVATPEATAILHAEIEAVCRQIDRRTGAPPGTAQKATYLYWWPPAPTDCVEVLACLHADAVIFLADITRQEER